MLFIVHLNLNGNLLVSESGFHRSYECTPRVVVDSAAQVRAEPDPARAQGQAEGPGRLRRGHVDAGGKLAAVRAQGWSSYNVSYVTDCERVYRFSDSDA